MKQALDTIVRSLNCGPGLGWTARPLKPRTTWFALKTCAETPWADMYRVGTLPGCWLIGTACAFCVPDATQ